MILDVWAAQGNQSLSRELRASALCPGLEARFPARRREERGCGWFPCAGAVLCLAQTHRSQCTSPKHPVSCIEPGLAIHFIYDIIHVSMPFSPAQKQLFSALCKEHRPWTMEQEEPYPLQGVGICFPFLLKARVAICSDCENPTLV